MKDEELSINLIVGGNWTQNWFLWKENEDERNGQKNESGRFLIRPKSRPVSKEEKWSFATKWDPHDRSQSTEKQNFWAGKGEFSKEINADPFG